MQCITIGRPCEGPAYASLSTTSTHPQSTSPSSSSLSRSLSQSQTTWLAVIRWPLYARPSSAPAPQLYGSAAVKELVVLAPQLPSLLELGLPVSPASAVTGLLAVRCSQLAIYLVFLPSRSGHSMALDSAILCLVAGPHDLAKPAAQRSSAKTLASYSRALHYLQRSLDHLTQRYSSETLCATQLLGIFELCYTLVFTKSAVLTTECRRAVFAEWNGDRIYGAL